MGMRVSAQSVHGCSCRVPTLGVPAKPKWRTCFIRSYVSRITESDYHDLVEKCNYFFQSIVSTVSTERLAGTWCPGRDSNPQQCGSQPHASTKIGLPGHKILAEAESSRTLKAEANCFRNSSRRQSVCASKSGAPPRNRTAFADFADQLVDHSLAVPVKTGTAPEIRTQTNWLLKPMPLPVGLGRQNLNLGNGRGATYRDDRQGDDRQ